MKNGKFVDSVVETQTELLNNWVDSAKKFQTAFTSGNLFNEGQNLYKDLYEKQANVFKKIQNNGSFQNSESNPVEFFKDMFNKQAAYAKQMTDFNQSIYNSFQNFGKPAQDYMSNFGQMNTSYTNIYNAWMHAINHSFETLNKQMNSAFNKDVFSNFMQNNQMYAKVQELFAPMVEAMQKGQFNAETFKNFYSPESYSSITKQMFGSFYGNAPLSDIFKNGFEQLQNFFANQNNLSKEYFEKIKSIAGEFPVNYENYGADALKNIYAQINNVFGRTFEPLLKIVTPGKEKENIEATITLLDKVTEYSFKQAELQMQLQATAQKAMEGLMKEYSEKYNTPDALSKMPDTKEMYNEWVKTNEKLFADLFATDEFSKLKGDTLNIGMEVKKHFEKQFEGVFSSFPFVFKTDIEELQKNIYDLKKQVKELQTRLAINNASAVELEEEKAKKGKK
ncbi:MAG: hypothetical protein JSU07_01665 [Bacteroidetes bacterium]|nr:hypothetical protein [Bacteroidota bacterium]